jgi:hypothetical protein
MRHLEYADHKQRPSYFNIGAAIYDLKSPDNDSPSS